MKSILHTGFGGLGDNLMFSTLPELYAKKGEQFYIDIDNPSRNAEIFNLVWGQNPYVNYSNPMDIGDQPNIGMCLTGNPYRPLGNNFIGSVEKHHGFEGTGKYPKIYRKLNMLEEWIGKCVIDLTAITRHSDYPNNIAEIALEEAKSRHNHKDNQIVFLTFPNVYSKNYLNISVPTHEVKSLYEYCDIINSCKTYISLHSGGNMLATAIKQDNTNPTIICYITKSLFEMLKNNGNQALFDNNYYAVI